MSKRTTIITLGIFVALMPFLGFPGAVETVFFIIAGLVLATIGYFLQTECEKCDTGERSTEIQTNNLHEVEKKEGMSAPDSSIVNDNT